MRSLVSMTNSAAPVSWFSTAGILQNGGLFPPGTEGMKSPAGVTKFSKKVEKDTSFNTDHRAAKPEAIAAPQKAVTRDRVISEGVYAWEDTQVRVRVSQTSKKPYGLVLREGNWEYTPGIVAKLKASDKIEVPAAQSAPKVTEGFYLHFETVAEVVKSGAGRLYAKTLDTETGRWDYAPGVIGKLKPEDRLTLAQAILMGKQFHRCMCCGRELTNPESIEYGIGPICREKL